jgi:hypothetical protein
MQLFRVCKTGSSFAELYYLDYTKNSDSHNREAKRINRELMIDVVLGLESDSGVENKFIEYLEDDMYSTVTSEIMSIHCSIQNLQQRKI